MEIADGLRTAIELSGWTRLVSLICLSPTLLIGSPSVRAQAVTEQVRPSLDNCAAVLTPGRAWRIEMVFSRVNGSFQDLDIGISDGTSDDTFVLRRAAQSFSECLARASDVPKPKDERPGKTSLGTRMTIESRTGEVKAAPPSASTKHAKQVQKRRPHIPECMEHLSSFETWSVTANFAITSEAIPKVKSWAISTDLLGSASGHKSLTRFAHCIGETLQISQKPRV